MQMSNEQEIRNGVVQSVQLLKLSYMPPFIHVGRLRTTSLEWYLKTNILNIKGFLFQCVVTMLVKQKWQKCLQEFSLSANADSTDQQILTGGISPNISILRVS